MAANGYQSQVAAINYTYEEDSVTKTGFGENTDIYALIRENLSPTIRAQNFVLTRLGIQANPKTFFQLQNYNDNFKRIMIGETGFYEINDVRISGLIIENAAEDVIIDYIVEEV